MEPRFSLLPFRSHMFPLSRRAFVLFLLTAAHCIGSEVLQSTPATSAPAALRVMTFNIRNSGARDGENHWSKRADLVHSTIREFNPDLLGLQEVLADQYDNLVQTFPEYAPAGVARDDGARKGEWAAALYRKDRFELLATGNFWLSEAPERVGAPAWDAACVRICTWTKLRDLSTKKEFLFANTHFDHEGKTARLNSARLLRTQLAKLSGGAPVILTGDFNSTEENEPYKLLLSVPGDEQPNQKQLFDSYRLVHPNRTPSEASFHEFKGTTAGLRIDWILHSKELKPLSAEIHQTNRDGRYSSDHYPVTAVLEWQ
ncbi:MAG: endonuclease/exonuclease/phosphatase family protein [Verrucomicrobiaceae bacterium]|nr:MAG: endonuclease/exonuclease/phosphatase family protein [Verrucomicrobiaceae bacterium]